MAAGDVLFVHNNFPAQLGFIADALKARGMRCAVIGSATAKSKDLPVRRWALKRGTTPTVFPLAVRSEADLLRARAAADCALAYRKQGFDPELIIGHPGWGETLLLSEIFPRARQIIHGEFFYRAQGADVGFDPEFGQLDWDERFRVHAKNMGLSLAYAQADAIVCPTPFQASTFPTGLRPTIRVQHEGVNTRTARPNPAATVKLPSGRLLDRSTPVITFINRNFEPLRGFHIFMRALPRLLAEAPEAEVVLIGSDGRGYGGESEGRSWKQRMLEELGERIDPKRLHFLGHVPYDQMLSALSISSAHVYFTYPFVLSWSLLDAMASECLVIASDTAPVRDVIEHGSNGLLVDFFDVDALSTALVRACREPAAFAPLRKAARETAVSRYDRQDVCLPGWLDLIDSVRAGR
jgi:glycosyltransferase involved in cell wall biosynthesis